jgi:chromosome segregation ATPase
MSSDPTAELSSREIAMVKGLQQLQSQLSTLTAQFQASEIKNQEYVTTISSQKQAIIAFQKMRSFVATPSTNNANNVVVNINSEALERNNILENELSLSREMLLKVQEEFDSFVKESNESLLANASANIDVNDKYSAKITELEELLASRKKNLVADTFKIATVQGKLTTLQEMYAVSQQDNERFKEREKELELQLEELKEIKLSLESVLIPLKAKDSKLSEDLKTQSNLIIELETAKASLQGQLLVKEDAISKQSNEFKEYKEFSDSALSDKFGDIHTRF